MYSLNLLKLMGTRLAAEFVKTPAHKEERLWKAVLVCAFEDCINTSGSKAEAYRKQEAHNWFIEDSEDFQNVCWLAGLDPLLVRNRYIYLIEENQIKFTELQKEWCKYRMNYKTYRQTRTTEQRKLIRNNIERIKTKIFKLKK